MSNESVAVARTLWLFGLSGAGKSTLADAVSERLRARGEMLVRLDGDVLRRGLTADLGFADSDRRENLRRAAETARLLNDQGLTVVASFISPLAADRALVRTILGDALVEVFVDAPLAVCEARDPKGLYRRARAGQLQQFTGISAPFERPAEGGVVVHTAEQSIDQAAVEVMAAFGRKAQ